jgi:hypothetical protein
MTDHFARWKSLFYWLMFRKGWNSPGEFEPPGEFQPLRNMSQFI